MKTDFQTWHHGLVARWWAEFNHDGPEIECFRRIVERFGTPALDAGCGTGRLLLPYLDAGLEVEGSDASADMLAACAAKAEELGLQPTLHHRAMHELGLGQRFHTLFVCGSFGLGGGRHEDLEALRRFHDLLLPGGALALDLHLPTANPRAWQHWLKEHRPTLPGPWSKPDRRRAADGTELELRSRSLAFDPLEQSYRWEIRIDHYHGDEHLGRSQHPLNGTLYFKNELQLMLEQAGFVEIEVRGGYEDREPEPWQDTILLLIARRAG